MDKWQFALVQLSESVKEMRALQRAQQLRPTKSGIAALRQSEAHVDSLLVEAEEAQIRTPAPTSPATGPHLVELPPVPPLESPDDVPVHPVPVLLVEQFELPPVPSLEVPPVPPAPAEEPDGAEKPKRGRRRGGQHNG